MSKQAELVDQVETKITDKYTYVLSMKNEARGRVYNENGEKIPDQEYPTRKNVLLKSSIVWAKETNDPFIEGKKRKAGRHLIRYYDGCTTLFVDDQPKDKETVEQLLKGTRELYFINGYLAVYGYDEMLKKYMDWCSWNEDSPYRVPTVDVIFKLMDIEKSRKEESNNLDRVEEALALAKEADEKKMMIHAQFLGVAMVDYVSSVKLSPTAVRTEYRKAAMSDPAKFIKTYNDKTIHIKHWIQQGLQSGELSTTVIPNKVSWAKKGVVICDISGITSQEGILNKLIEFSQTPAGEAFKEQLTALYN